MAARYGWIPPQAGERRLPFGRNSRCRRPSYEGLGSDLGGKRFHRLQQALKRRTGEIDPKVLNSHLLIAVNALQDLGGSAGKERALPGGCSVGELHGGAQPDGNRLGVAPGSLGNG